MLIVVALTAMFMLAAYCYFAIPFSIIQLNLDAQDNNLTERYQRIQLGMSAREVRAILGWPNIGAKSSEWGVRKWGDQQFILALMVSNPEERVLSKELFHRATRKNIAKEP